MIVEVHDRDRKLDNMKLKPTLFGDDLEDEKISNVGTVTSQLDKFFICVQSFSSLVQVTNVVTIHLT